MKKKLKIKLVDFQEGFIPERLLLLQRLSEMYDVVLTDRPDWVIFSVFGTEHLKYNDCVKIFWTGENQAPDFNLCDYAIAFDHISFEDRYLRIPLWMSYPDDVRRMLAKHENVDLAGKTEFCSFVYSNSNSSRHREEFFAALNTYKKVNSGGRYLNNIGQPVADKLAFQFKHKFAIAFENASHNGYTTEKLVQAFAAQTVPLYWGDPRVEEEFNPAAFVNCAAYRNWDEVVERVREIDNDDNMWLEILHQPALRYSEAADRYLEQLDAFLKHIFEQEPDAAKRFSRDYWTLKQQRQRMREVKAYNRSLFSIMRRFYMKHIYLLTRKSPFLWSITQRLMRIAKV